MRLLLKMNEIEATSEADITPEGLANAFNIVRERLGQLAQKRVNPILLRRISVEDILQETLKTMLTKLHYFTTHLEVPLYFKFRTLLLQTIAELERFHLQSKKRDPYREVSLEDSNFHTDIASDFLELLPATISSPLTKVARLDRHALLLQALETLPTIDKHILTLRHFDGCSNIETARILNLSEKAASIRYVRALVKLQEKLVQFTEFTIDGEY